MYDHRTGTCSVTQGKYAQANMSASVFGISQCICGQINHFCELSVVNLPSIRMTEMKFQYSHSCLLTLAQTLPHRRSEVRCHTHIHAPKDIVSSTVRGICGKCVCIVGPWVVACDAGNSRNMFVRSVHTPLRPNPHKSARTYVDVRTDGSQSTQHASRMAGCWFSCQPLGASWRLMWPCCISWLAT